MTAVLRLWRGALPLSEAFWNWAVIGGLAVNISTSAGFLFLISVDWPIAALFVGYALSLPYNLLVTVGVWRAADRDQGDRQRAEAMRLLTAAAMVFISIF